MMRRGRWLLICLLGIAAAVAGLPAHAQSSMTFRLVQPNILHQEVYADGLIDNTTPGRFANFVSANGVRPSAMLYFNSPGGDLIAGIKLGALIRRAGLNTDVGTAGRYAMMPQAGMCASACTFAFLGGVTRHMTQGSHYGVHRFAGGGFADPEQSTQKIAGALVEYIHDMGVSREMYTLMTRAGNDERNDADKVLWLDAATMARLRITTTEAVTATMTDRNGVAVLVVKDDNGGSRYGRMDFFCSNRKLMARGYFPPDSGARDAPSVQWLLWLPGRSNATTVTVPQQQFQIAGRSGDALVVDVTVPARLFNDGLLQASGIWLRLQSGGRQALDTVGLASGGLPSDFRTLLRTTAYAC